LTSQSQALPQPPSLSFTKLVVNDIEAMGDFYCAAFDLHRGSRDAFEHSVEGEAIDELSLVTNPNEPYGNLTLLKFVNRPPTATGEVILGFTTSDLTSLLDQIERAGGSLVGRIKTMPTHGIRVAFVRDPEGHLSELVEMKTTGA
jgi:predicted enzyme related to lactoylglutathione lyase